MHRTWSACPLGALVGWMVRTWAALNYGHSVVSEVGLVLQANKRSNEEYRPL